MSPDEELVLLDEQDRSLWNREQIVEGVALVERAFDLESHATQSSKVLSKPARSLTGSKR